MYGDSSLTINMSGLNARLFPAPFAIHHSLQRPPTRRGTKALQGTSPLAYESLVAARAVAGVREKKALE